MSEQPFWQRKRLDELSREEWESLCDGCARCCLIKLEDEESGELAYTGVVCRHLDLETCRCNEYARRSETVPECLTLGPDNLDELQWAPASCAYRLLAEGDPLPPWHPLLTGSSESVHEAGYAVSAFAISETELESEDELEEFIIEWREEG